MVKRRVLVTGGAGFIGSHLVDALVKEGHEVIVLDDLSNGDLNNLNRSIRKVDFLKGSILDEAAVGEATAGCDAVFHLAAISSVAESLKHPQRVHQVNATGSLNVLEAARRNKARVIFSSSASVYGDAPGLPKRESDEVRPISLYGAQKLLAENYLLSYCLTQGLEGISLRYFNVYGPRQNPNSPYSGVISVYLERAAAGDHLVIHGDGSQTRDFISVHDVVAANLACLSRTRLESQVVNIGTGIETSILRLAMAINDLAENKAPLHYSQARPGDIRRSVCDPETARSELRFVAKVGLVEGLAETLRSVSREPSWREKGLP